MAFTQDEIDKVWGKAKNHQNSNNVEWAKDVADAWIRRDYYGLETAFGWEIDHVYPESKGGDNFLPNLRPMHWENNRTKSDDYPTYNTKITSEGTSNVEKPQTFTVNDKLQAVLKKKYNIQ